MSVFIIAEAGVNHNGSISIAKRLIDIAAKAGADAVKFQTFKASLLCKKNAPKTSHQKRNISNKITQFEMLKNLELSKNDFEKIFKLCKKISIEFISTPYDIESVELLESIGIKTYKISSADLVDLRLNERVIQTKKNVILSTGASTLKEIIYTVNFYKKKNINNYSLLHCVSNYPYNENNSNLNIIKKFKNMFKCKIGFSDHGKTSEPAKIAVALGAEIIEKHLTYDKNAMGPDHSSSFDPSQFRAYINDIRKTEKIIGSSQKKILLEEKSFRKYARKSIYLTKNLKKNTKILNSHLELKRPGTGLNGQYLKAIVGRKIKKSLKKNSQLKLSDLKL